MRQYLFKISTKLKDEIKDPQGQVVEKISKRLKIFNEINVKVGKFYEISFFAESLDEAKTKAGELAQNILTNPVIEEYQIIDIKEIQWRN